MMDMNRSFQQRWDFRRKDDEVDSMSDDSKSSSGNEPAGKKHKLVLVLSSPEKDDEATDLTQQKSQVNPTRGRHFQIAKAKKPIDSGKKRNAADKKSKRDCGEKRKRKRKANQNQDPALLGDLKTFTASLLEEIKVARKKMLVKMRKQITKLATAKPVMKPRRQKCVPKSDVAMHQSGKKSGRKTQTCNGKLTKGERRSNGKLKVALEKTEVRSSAVKKPLHFLNDSDQIGSSSCLTLPAVLPQPQTERLNGDYSSCDHIQCGISGTSTNNAEKEKSLADTNNPYSYFLGNVEQITSKDVLSVLPLPLHQWSNDGFKLRSRSLMENPARENNRMHNGNMGFFWEKPCSAIMP